MEEWLGGAGEGVVKAYSKVGVSYEDIVVRPYLSLEYSHSCSWRMEPGHMLKRLFWEERNCGLREVLR